MANTKKLNELELQRDFKNFCRRMRLLSGHPNLEVFLSQIEHELFWIPDKSLTCSNLTKEEWEAIRSLTDGHPNS